MARRQPLTIYVKLKLFCEVTGYTEKAVYQKIHAGTWSVFDGQYVKAPDGSILMNLEGYEQWASGGQPQTGTQARPVDDVDDSDTAEIRALIDGKG